MCVREVKKERKMKNEVLGRGHLKSGSQYVPKQLEIIMRIDID